MNLVYAFDFQVFFDAVPCPISKTQNVFVLKLFPNKAFVVVGNEDPFCVSELRCVLLFPKTLVKKFSSAD